MPRRRKSGRRTPSGRLSRAGKPREARIEPTAETAAKRQALVNGSDPALSASAIGVLFANAHLTEEQYIAAQRYSRAHAIVFGRLWSHVQNSLGAPLPQEGEPPSDELHAWAEHQLDKWNARLDLPQRQAIANVAVFDWIPTYLFLSKLRLKILPEDESERAALLTGLDALVACMGLREANAKDAAA
jgi:hypothetical protein